MFKTVLDEDALLVEIGITRERDGTLRLTSRELKWRVLRLRVTSLEGVDL